MICVSSILIWTNTPPSPQHIKQTDLNLDHVQTVVPHFQHYAEYIQYTVVFDVLQQAIDGNKRAGPSYTSTGKIIINSRYY